MTGEYNALQSLYDTLNQTYTDSLQDSKDLEERVSRSESSQTIDQIIMFVFTVAVAVLVAFIIYLKRKKEQPYVVIRKETVSMKPDEKT
jgi:type IV secretory pathway component VirB8